MIFIKLFMQVAKISIHAVHTITLYMKYQVEIIISRNVISTYDIPLFLSSKS